MDLAGFGMRVTTDDSYFVLHGRLDLTSEWETSTEILDFGKFVG